MFLQRILQVFGAPVSGCRFAETARQFCGGILHIQDRVLRNNLSSSSGFYLLLLLINV